MCRPTPRTDPELEVFATIIHTDGALVNFLGLVFNLKRLPRNRLDVILHGIGFIYHTSSAVRHYMATKHNRVDNR